MEASIRVIRKDRKYSLISPFWLEVKAARFVWRREAVLGRIISVQVESNRVDADFWPIERLVAGGSRCRIVGK